MSATALRQLLPLQRCSFPTPAHPATFQVSKPIVFSSRFKPTSSFRRRAGAVAMSGGSDVFALDFDGVICDSCGESSQSALKAAKQRWPDVFKGVNADVDQWILEKMREVRPVVETGYENMLLVRCLLNIKHPEKEASEAAPPLTVSRILDQWEEIKPGVMSAWGEHDKQLLVEQFGDVRDEWMKNDFEGWMGANSLYPGVAQALNSCQSPLYIVTTKQTRFALALLKHFAGIDFPADRMYGLGSGPKPQVLEKLQADHPTAKLHFVEDRLSTLKNVIAHPSLQGWSLYLADWGYNTEEERKQASSIERIQVVDLATFCSTLK